MSSARRTVAVRVPIPAWVLNRLSRTTAGAEPVVTLAGDRDVEWSWVASQIPTGPGDALDFGTGGSHLAFVAAQRGFRVAALDLQPVRWAYAHPDLSFVQGDLLQLSLPPRRFDLVINCSTVEHVGLTGRYGVGAPSPDGDLTAMAYLRGLMKPGAAMVLTIPVGRDAVIGSLHRVYGPQRLGRLLDGYDVEKQQYWAKNPQNVWMLVDRPDALTVEPSAHLYALGCFVLRVTGGPAC